MKGLNWHTIMFNIVAARETLEQIEANAKKGERGSEIELETSLEHAYHHMNFAWNVRHEPTKRYANLTDEDFNLWSKFPREIDAYHVEGPAKTTRTTKKKAKAGPIRGNVSRRRAD